MDKTFAVILSNALPVMSTYPEHVAPEHVSMLTLPCPNGWDDVKTISKRVLEFAGRTFTFRGWNSDRNEMYFHFNGTVATIQKR